ncbi:unnamed protein product [Mortierella alpina]
MTWSLLRDNSFLLRLVLQHFKKRVSLHLLLHCVPCPDHSFQHDAPFTLWQKVFVQAVVVGGKETAIESLLGLCQFTLCLCDVAFESSNENISLLPESFFLVMGLTIQNKLRVEKSILNCS